MKAIHVAVAGFPPARDGGKSIFSEFHRHNERVVELLREARWSLDRTEWNPYEEGPVGLELVVVEKDSGFGGDGVNFLGGVADALQGNRHGVDLSHLGDLDLVSLYRDEAQVREWRYWVEEGYVSQYRVRVWLL